VTAKEFLYDWGGANVWLFQAINLHPPGRLDEFMEWLSRIGSYWNLPLVAGGWLAVALLLRQANSSMAAQVLMQLKRLLVGAAIAFVLTAGLKLALDFPRPAAVLAPSAIHVDVVAAGEREYSLPSGHAAFAALLAASLWPLIGLPGQLTAALFALGVGLSRIWLGAHFPADIVAGYAVGLASAALAILQDPRKAVTAAGEGERQ
jgi:signal peptidase II